MFEFCQTSYCTLRMGEELMDYTCHKLGIKPGKTTSDGLFSECFGACGYASTLQLRDLYHELVTQEKVDALIDECLQGKTKLD